MRATLRKQKKLRGLMFKLVIPDFPFTIKEHRDLVKLGKRFIDFVGVEGEKQ